MSSIRISGGQFDFLVGDIAGNTSKIIKALDDAEAIGSDVLVLPELAITGYPPEDLLLNPGFVEANIEALDKIRLASKDKNVTVLVGFADQIKDITQFAGLDAFTRPLANAVAVIRDAKIVGVVHKTLLPTYGVFDEARYFAPSLKNEQLFSVGDLKFGVPICEDLWSPGVSDHLAARGADILLVPNASPYHQRKAEIREELVEATAKRTGVPVVYVATVGGQDEVVFDGGSIAANNRGEIVARSGSFVEDFFTFDLEVPSRGLGTGVTANESLVEQVTLLAPKKANFIDVNAEVYLALVTGLKAYINKNHFRSIVLGLSGGIDSALVAVLAADAFGGDKVWGIGMPGPYSSGGSVSDARDLAERIGCKFDVLSIKELYETELRILRGTATEPGPFANTVFDSSEENMQARLRMTLLMSISNKHGNLLLTTGNKSETSVGYCTLYGDTAGGFAPIKDVYKTLVFDLCEWRNTLSRSELDELGLMGSVDPIPSSTITKPPSAELAPDQRDDQSLPPYPVLDGILERYIEKIMSPSEIIEDGFDVDMVKRIVRLVDINEYKRRQAAPGVKITKRAFGRDRRLPITNAWRPTVSAEVVSRERSTFVTKAEIESILSKDFNAMGISSWWERAADELMGMTPNEIFRTDPNRVADFARECITQ